MKKYIYVFVIVFLFITIQTAYCEDKFSLINEVFNKTNFKINELFNLKSMSDFKVSIRKWNTPAPNSNYSNNFQQESKEIQIQNTISLYVKTVLNKNMNISFLLANFKNKEDAELGLRDQFSLSLTPEYKTLFCGEKIPGLIIYGRTYITQGIAYFIYKNCVCRLTFYKTGHNKLVKDELRLVDDFIKLIIRIIDISITQL